MPRHHLRAAGLALFAAATPCVGQTIDDARDELRDRLSSVHFAKSLASLVIVSDELELSGASYEFDDEAGTELTTYALPFQTTLSPWGEESTGIHLEGVLAYARARQHADDLYDGNLPGLETSIDTDWTTYGGLIGAGPEFRLAEELTLAGIANVGMARIENDADYGGPGAAFTAALADGIAFNWDALIISAGLAARADWTRPLGEHLELELVGRYDVRWTRTIYADDVAQEFSTRAQLLTLRADLVGPTGLTIFDGGLDWRTTAGYRRFLEGDLFGVDDFIHLGGGLELDVADALPIVSEISLSFAVFLGPGLSGWSIGGGASF